MASDPRPYITVQTGERIWHVSSNRKKAYQYVFDRLIAVGIDPSWCRIRVANPTLGEAGVLRVFSYGPLRDLLNKANPDIGEGVDVTCDGDVKFRLQLHHVNEGR
jgi:hypothetical protein